MNKRKSIAVNTRFLLHDRLEGIGYYTQEIIKRIVLFHPEIDFYFLFDRKYSKEFIFADNVKPVVLLPPARHTFLWLWWFEFSGERWLKKNKPDLILSFDGYGYLRTRIPQIIVIHDLGFEHFPEQIPLVPRTYYKFFMPRFARKAKRIITVSQFSKQDIINRYAIPGESIEVVYNGVKDNFQPIDNESRVEIQSQYSMGKEYFLYVGSIHPRKNVDRLLQAFELFKEETGSGDKLLIAGKTFWDYKEVEDIYSKMRFKDDVIFTGYVATEELARITAAANCVVFVSLFEGFGVPIIEAMKSEVPVITSNVSSMPEIAGEAALLIDPTSISEIVSAMKKIISDPELRKSLIEKGKEQAKKFSWDVSAKKLWKVCEEILHKAS